MRDSQRQKVYDWEQRVGNHLFKLPKMFLFEEIQEYVDHVWSEMGLKYPPAVEAMHGKNQNLGEASRLAVYFPKNENTAQQTIIHELAHSMTRNIHDSSLHHGPGFVGMYMELMIKFMNADRYYLWFSAEKEGVKFQKFMKPVLTDDENFYY